MQPRAVPGIALACDLDVQRARSSVACVLNTLGGADRSVCGVGPDWAAAAIAPPGSEPTAGGQFCTNGQHALVWAGEIFLPDHWQISQLFSTDREAAGAGLLDQLRRHGAGILGDVDGAFCGAWFDPTRRTWTVFTDRLGLIPLFYWSDDERLIVSPRASTTWLASGRPLEIDEDGVAGLLRCGNSVDENTLIRDVHWLRGGHLLEWRPGTTHSTCYWDFHFDDRADQSAEESIEDHIGVLEHVMDRLSRPDGDLRLGISGGIDSRLMLAMCAELKRVPSCFTVGWVFADDVRFGRKLARAAGARHDWIPLEAERLIGRIEQAILDTDGLHSARHLGPVSTLHDYLDRVRGSVVLEGYMQGVLGGAYVPADDDVAENTPPHACNWARQRLHAGGDPELIDRLLAPGLSERSWSRWQARINEAWQQAPTRDPLARAEYAVLRSRSGRIDALGTALLQTSVLVRSPACHLAMLDWHARTPPRLRRGKRLMIEILTRRFPHLARVPRSGAGGLPLSGERWRREVCWQRERLQRGWTHLRHQWTKRWGTGGPALTAWTFDTWRRKGGLRDLLMPRSAHVQNWVRRDVLRTLWRSVKKDPRSAGPLLTLATIETMIRWLESVPREGIVHDLPGPHAIDLTSLESRRPIVVGAAH